MCRLQCKDYTRFFALNQICISKSEHGLKANVCTKQKTASQRLSDICGVHVCAAFVCMHAWEFLHDRWLSRATAWAQVYVTEKQEGRKSQSEQHRMCIHSEQHSVCAAPGTKPCNVKLKRTGAIRQWFDSKMQYKCDNVILYRGNSSFDAIGSKANKKSRVVVYINAQCTAS